MALQVSIKTENGVVLNYHHIAAINVEVNQRVTIIVESYIDQEGRQYDKDYMSGKIIGEPTFPYTSMDYPCIQWNDVQSTNILTGDLLKNAYEWLKTQPNYINALDV